MSALNEYYRSYMALLESMGEVDDFKAFNAAFKAADKGKDFYTSKVSIREFDIDWIEAMEAALPYIDKSIREQRRFILQTDEIVPIEKSKKITTESVRHLAQHTNMIGRVEKDTVTPKEILNIQREESFDIYENRYLRTLILRCSSFIERCYKETVSSNNDFFVKLGMHRDGSSNKQNIKFDLNLELEYPGDSAKFLMNQDVNELTEYQRVLRLRLIFSDFLSTPLMRTLNNVPEVRSPINQTNILTKDTNFRETVKLWTFLDHYAKKGYTVIASDDVKTMKSSVQKGIYNVMSLMQFVVRLNLNPSLSKTLKEEYHKENQQIEQQRKEYEAKLVNDALEKQRKAFNEKVLSYQMQIINLKNENKASLKTQKEEYENKTKELINQYENKLTSSKLEYEKDINNINNQHQEAIKNINNEHQEIVKNLNSKHQETVKNLNNEYQTTVRNLKKQHTSEIKTINQNFDKESRKKDRDYSLATNRLTKSYEQQLAKSKKSYDSAMLKSDKQHATLMAKNTNELNAQWRKVVAEKTDFYNEKIRANNAYWADTKQRNQSLNNELKKCKYEIRELNKDLRAKSADAARSSKKLEKLEKKLSKA